MSEVVDNYHKTFALDDVDEIKKFFRENGYVAIRDVLTQVECQRTIDEFGTILSEKDSRFKIGDASTYEHAPLANRYGMISGTALFTPQVLQNRQNPRIYKAFQCLREDKTQLIVNHDSGCLYRRVLVSEQETGIYRRVLVSCSEPKLSWKTPKPDLHLDLHPSGYAFPEVVQKKRESLTYDDLRDFMTENNMICESDGLQLAGVINLMDNHSRQGGTFSEMENEDGGFQCVPGFHLKFDEWRKKFKTEGKEAKVELGSYHFSPEDITDKKYVKSAVGVRVAVPAGTVIIWDQRLAHGSVPNHSIHDRCAQFIKFFSINLFSTKRLQTRARVLEKHMKLNKSDISPLGKAVFGIEITKTKITKKR